MPADSDGVSLDARMPENTPGHSFMDFHPLGITPALGGLATIMVQISLTHGWGKAVAYRMGYFTGQGRDLLRRKSCPTCLLIFGILCGKAENIL